MKLSQVTLALALAGLALASCGKEEPAATPASSDAVGSSSVPSSAQGDSPLDAAGKTAGDLASKATESFEKAKSSLLSSGASKLTELAPGLESLKTRAAKVPAESKAVYDTAVQTLTTQYTTLKAELENLKGATLESWEKASGAFSKSLTDFQTKLTDALSKFGAGK